MQSLVAKESVIGSSGFPIPKVCHPGRWTAGTYSHHPFRVWKMIFQTIHLRDFGGSKILIFRGVFFVILVESWPFWVGRCTVGRRCLIFLETKLGSGKPNIEMQYPSVEAVRNTSTHSDLHVSASYVSWSRRFCGVFQLTTSVGIGFSNDKTSGKLWLHW